VLSLDSELEKAFDMIDKNAKRALTFEQWSVINRALCGARLELNGVTMGKKRERVEALGDALTALNDFEEIASTPSR